MSACDPDLPREPSPEGAGRFQPPPPGTRVPTAAASTLYRQVCASWTDRPIPARRSWRKWSRHEPALLGIDPFAAWDLTQDSERRAFAALSTLATTDSDAMGAWCTKANTLWSRQLRRGRNGGTAPAGVPLGSISTALATLDRDQLAANPYPFRYVISRARTLDRYRRQHNPHPTPAAAARQRGAIDGMDTVVELLDTMTELNRLVASTAPRHRPAAAAKADTLLNAFLNGHDPEHSATVHRCRLRLRQLRQAA